MQTITFASLTSFDWFLIAIVAFSTVAAFMRGIIKVLFSIGGLIAGILIASWNYLPLAARLHRIVISFQVAQVIAFLLILVVVMVLFTLAARLLRKAVSTVGLGILDRLLGAVFGLARGILLGVALMMALAAFVPQSVWLHDSRLAPFFLAGADAVAFIVPQHFREQVTNGTRHLLQQTPELFKPHTLTQSM